MAVEGAGGDENHETDDREGCEILLEHCRTLGRRGGGVSHKDYRHKAYGAEYDSPRREPKLVEPEYRIEPACQLMKPLSGKPVHLGGENIAKKSSGCGSEEHPVREGDPCDTASRKSQDAIAAYPGREAQDDAGRQHGPHLEAASQPETHPSQVHPPPAHDPSIGKEQKDPCQAEEIDVGLEQCHAVGLVRPWEEGESQAADDHRDGAAVPDRERDEGRVESGHDQSYKA